MEIIYRYHPGHQSWRDVCLAAPQGPKGPKPLEPVQKGPNGPKPVQEPAYDPNVNFIQGMLNNAQAPKAIAKVAKKAGIEGKESNANAILLNKWIPVIGAIAAFSFTLL